MCDCGCGTCGEQEMIFDSDGTFGVDWTGVLGQVGGQAASAGLAMLFGGGRGGGSGSGCLVGQVSGDQAMTNCVPRVMALFDELESLIGMYPAEQIIAQANQIAGIFSDDRYFDQSIGGRSRQIREAAQAAARQRAQSIIAAVGGFVASTGYTQSGGQPAAPAATGNAVTIDTKTVLLAGGGLLLIMLLLK